MPITEAFAEIAALASRMGVRRINEIEGCWETDIDTRWWISVNGHGQTTTNSHGVEVPPFSAYVEFNGWPAGIINPGDGVIAAGDAANEQAFIEALKAAPAN